ncbi:hypothetical protein Peur_013098 [Populus x canadensis]
MSGSYKGVRLASGLDIFSQKLVLDPSYTLLSPPASQSDLLHGTLCDDVNQGKRLLNAAMNALLTVPNSVNSESSSTVQHENIEEKPTVLWRELYIQEITMVHVLLISSVYLLFIWLHIFLAA